MADEALESTAPNMLRTIAARLLAPPIATLVLMAPLAATPVGAFEIEKQDWGDQVTAPEDLPQEYHYIRRCAEAGDTDCQVMMAQVWAGEEDGDVWNPDERARWAQKAALQGHRQAFHEFSRYLCWFEPENIEGQNRYLIEGIGWLRLAEHAEGRARRDVVQTCLAAFILSETRPADLPALLEAGERRAEELRKEVPQPWHGEFRHFFWD